MHRARWGRILLASLLLAGCASVDPPSEDPAEPQDSTQSAPTPRTEPDEISISDRPHVHDYWGGALSIILLDEDVPVMLAHNHFFDEPPREEHTHGCDEKLASDSQGGSRKFSLPEGMIVLPGTEQLSFLIDWSDATITGVRLLYRPANTHDLVDAGLVTNGRAIRVAATQDMTDAGHATRTSWVFFLCADGDPPVDLAEGSVHVNLIATRGEELPLEPPHPDHWKNGLQIELANLTAVRNGATAANKGDAAWLILPVEHGHIIPPETKRVRAHVSVDDHAPTADALPLDVTLYYRDSSVPEWIYKTVNVTQREFIIDVDHNMVDGPYAEHTNWDFWLRLSSPQPTATPAGVMSQPRVIDATVAVHLLAERDPAPEAAS